MSRLTTIALDNTPGVAPASWSAEWVQRRLVEAFSIERRLPAPIRKQSGSWPAMSYEFADVVGWDDARERVLEHWARTEGAVFSADLSRMEAAHDWLRVILGGHNDERICLAQWAAAIAYRRSLRMILERKRWARSTFYRKVFAGSWIIAQELERRGEPVS